MLFRSEACEESEEPRDQPQADDGEQAEDGDRESNASTRGSSSVSTTASLRGPPSKFARLTARSEARLAAHLAKKNASEDRIHMVTSDHDEEVCRKALAVFNGTDGGASLREVVTNLWQVTQS